ncbi:MAG: TlpA disulfide reductase family protein [Bacteroidales bacterium]|jgi:peroxiredoxin
MKKIAYLLLMSFLIAGCNSKTQFHIKADIKGSDNMTFKLYGLDGRKFVVIDSAISKNGTFKMTGSVKYPMMTLLRVTGKNQQEQLFLENSKITITGKIDSLQAAKVTGSKTQDEFQSFDQAIKPVSQSYNEKYTQYQTAVQSGDTAAANSIEKEGDLLQVKMSQIKKIFIKNHPSSYFSPTLIQQLSYQMEPEEIEAQINSLDTNVAKTDIIQTLKERVKAMKTVEVGEKAPDFTLNDVNGNPVSLSSRIGPKLLLVDFWASWCHPCRMENPNVVKIFKEFHKKGFDVLGVSLDMNKEDWIKAISDDKLAWTHVSDLQYWNNAAAKLYAINSIPANFLLDETGTIIGRNLRGDDLVKKVNEILGNVSK